MTDPKILARIRGLLAKAESTEFPEEAKNLRAKAYELIGTYGIDEAVATAQAGHTQEVKGITLTVADDGGYANQQLDLAYWVGDAIGCWVLMTYSQEARARRLLGKRQSYDQVSVYGYANLVELTEILYTSLLLQLSGEREKITAEEARSHGYKSTRSFRTSWGVGWVSEVRTRLRHAYTKAAEDKDAETGSSTALVLADNKEIFKTVGMADTNTTKIVSGRAPRVHTKAYEAGREAGRRADIHQTRVGGTREQLTG